MRLATMIGLALCLAAPAAAFGEAGKVLKDKDITESALIDALTPEVRTRSIKIMREGQVAPPVAAKPAAASLLITFETGSATLTPRAKRSLDVVARALDSDKLTDFRFSIEGHADPRGGDEYNLRLSQARAESVVNYLADTHHIARERLKPIGKGDAELLNAAHPDAPENRRVTIKTLVD
jgi:outer membrane protein OmpA-like peptidoglycan-associated protein